MRLSLVGWCVSLISLEAFLANAVPKGLVFREQRRSTARLSSLHGKQHLLSGRADEEPEKAEESEGAGESLEDKLLDIKDKWDKMGQFLEIMFVIACRQKHKTDVHGLAVHKMKNEGLTLKEFNEVKRDIHDKNLVELKQACGMIVAKGEKNCRLGCAESFNAKLELRQECDQKCVKSYENFQKTCMSKAGDLEVVYKQEVETQENMQKCLIEHCERFPTVYTKEKEDQKAEVEAQCDKYCEEDRVEQRCGMKVRRDEAFWGGAIKDDCWGKTNKVQECYEKEKKVEGPDGILTPEQLKEELGKAKKKCEAESEKEFKKCVDESFEKRREEELKTCVKEGQPQCKKDCAKTCEVDRMNACLDKADIYGNPTQDYCSSMWKFLHESSDVDPVTGMPIVLIQPHKGVPSIA